MDELDSFAKIAIRPSDFSIGYKSVRDLSIPFADIHRRKREKKL